MMYIVTFRFADLEDNKYIYEVGDTYPRKGKSVSDSRIALLMSNKNLVGRPLIEKAFEEKAKKRRSKEK